MKSAGNLLVMSAAGIGALVVVSALLLWIGEFARRLFPRMFSSALSATIHVIAIGSYLLGLLLVWVISHGDGKKALIIPVVLPVLLYCSIVFMWLKSLALRAILSIMSWPFGRGGPEE